MMWLTWRQHRAEAGFLVLLIAIVGGLLVILGLPMHAAFHDGIAPCLNGGLDAETCSANMARFQQDYGFSTAMLTLFNVVPLEIGAFLGAPLLAREIESGTWQLAWTQAIPRMRWLAVKLAALAAVTVICAAGFGALTTWYRQPLDILYGPFAPAGFDVEGLAPAAYALFAFALAAASGAILRRTLPALITALAGFTLIRVVVETVLRPNYRPPLTLVQDQFEITNDWLLDSGYADAHGRHLTRAEFDGLQQSADATNTNLTTYLHDHGVQGWITYQPAARLWAFQFIEAGIFATLAALLLTLVISQVKRRAY